MDDYYQSKTHYEHLHLLKDNDQLNTRMDDYYQSKTHYEHLHLLKECIVSRTQ